MRLRHLLRGERGLAVAAVLILGLSIVMLSSVVVVRSLRQSNTTLSDAGWEQALQVAESGLDEGLVAVAEDDAFTTGEVLPDSFAGNEDARVWMVAAADARGSIDLRTTPLGEYVVVRPSNTEMVFAVGYVPTRAAETRRVRVVGARIGDATINGSWLARYALLAGDQLEMGGNPTIISGATVGVHANGFLDVRGNLFVDGCLSASDGANVTGSIAQDPGCGAPGIQAPVEVPVVDVRSFWVRSEYDLCPGGRVKAGPSHPTHGHTVGNTPCTGSTLEVDAALTPYHGWIWDGYDAKLGADWRYVSQAAYDGVYYVYQGSVDLASSPGSPADPWEVTIVTEGIGACPEIVGGDVEISGSPSMAPDPDAQNLLIAVGRDLEISGGPNLTGIVAVHEQIRNIGHPEGVETAWLAEGACDSSNDWVDVTDISGNATISNSGPIASPFAGSNTVPVVMAWGEL
jgi:hypothetical protein